MPTYQYACTSADCGNRFELVQSFTDPAATDCPSCGGPVRKVFSAVGVVFKGSGFYRTDSRSSGKGTVSGSSAPKDSGTSNSDSSSSATTSSTPAKSESSSAGGSTGKVAASA